MGQPRIKLNANLPLDQLKIPYLETVLEEAFYWPPARIFGGEPPRTVGELVKVCSVLPEDEVLRRLREIIRLSQGVLVSARDFEKLMLNKDVIILDLRKSPHSLGYSSEHPYIFKVQLRKSFGTEQDPQAPKMFETFQAISALKAKLTRPCLAVFHDDPAAGFSVAMFFREKGLLEAYARA